MSVRDAVCPPRSPSLVKFAYLHASTGLTQFASSSPAGVQLVQLCRDTSPRDHYDGDVDTDCDDVISSCIRRRRRSRRRSWSASNDAIVVSSDSSSDQSQTPWTSRDHRGGSLDQSVPPMTSRDHLLNQDGADVTSSGDSESDDSVHQGGAETDLQPSSTNSAAADIERSPVLFSEPFAEHF